MGEEGALFSLIRLKRSRKIELNTVMYLAAGRNPVKLTNGLNNSDEDVLD
jgi:hypothetical protein